MSILDTPLLPCTDCGLPTCGECEACDEPVCGRCAYRGRCVDCAEVAQALNEAILDYERSVL